MLTVFIILNADILINAHSPEFKNNSHDHGTL